MWSVDVRRSGNEAWTPIASFVGVDEMRRALVRYQELHDEIAAGTSVFEAVRVRSEDGIEESFERARESYPRLWGMRSARPS